MNGKNGLACITPLSETVRDNKLVLRPLPGLPVIRDLVVDMGILRPVRRSALPAEHFAGTGYRAAAVAGRPGQAGWAVRVYTLCLLLHRLPLVLVEPRSLYRPRGPVAGYRFLADTRDTATESAVAAG